jgi:hypothetical protein
MFGACTAIFNYILSMLSKNNTNIMAWQDRRDKYKNGINVFD